MEFLITEKQNNKLFHLYENQENEMRCYHGTKTEFTKFDTDFMGEGEGAQYYGWGVYVSECHETAVMYAREAAMNVGSYYTINGKCSKSVDEWVDIANIERLQQEVLEKGLNPHLKQNIINALDDEITRIENDRKKTDRFCKGETDNLLKYRYRVKKFLLSLTDKYLTIVKMKQPQEIVYEVDIPDDTGENYIYWTRSIFELNDSLLSEFAKMIYENPYDFEYVKKEDLLLSPRQLNWRYIQSKGWKYEEFYEYILSKLYNVSPKELSLTLYNHGYDGTKMPIMYQTFHGENLNQYGWNYVLFNADDVHIIKKNIIKEDIEDDEYNVGSEGGNNDYFHVNEMKAYHGSGARFKKFDSNFNGSGEGSASFGPGHYFTSSKLIGKDYATNHGTSKRDIYQVVYKNTSGDYTYQAFNMYRDLTEIINLKKYDDEHNHEIWKLFPKLMHKGYNKQTLIHEIYKVLLKVVKTNEDYVEDKDWYEYKLKKALNLLKNNLINTDRTLYQVEIPDADKYINLQTEATIEMFKISSNLIDNLNVDDNIKHEMFENANDSINWHKEHNEKITVRDFWLALNNMYYDGSYGDNVFIQTMKRLGYVGTTYPSSLNYQTSSTKEGDMNYTIFDDNNIKITNRWDY